MTLPKSFLLIAILILLAVILLAIILVAVSIKQTQESPAVGTDYDYESLFSLNRKVPQTRLYVSEKLGIGFTYNPSPSEDSRAGVAEIQDSVEIDSQKITVFSKDPVLSLDEVVRQMFLEGFSSDDCFVADFDTGLDYPEYFGAVIAFPFSESPELALLEGSPWQEFAQKCPQEYSLAQGTAFFLMNPQVPDKFVFVREGWNYSATTDGTPIQEDVSAPNWTRSLRILW